MLETKLKNLVTFIKSEITHFGDHGYFVDPLKDREDGFNGVTDEIDSYFFIQIIQPPAPQEYVFTEMDSSLGGSGYETRVECFLIAETVNADQNLLAQAFVSTLKRFGSLDIELRGGSSNSDIIYKTVYGEDVSYEGDLLMINFRATDHLMFLGDCDLDFCEGGC